MNKRNFLLILFFTLFGFAASVRVGAQTKDSLQQPSNTDSTSKSESTNKAKIDSGRIAVDSSKLQARDSVRLEKKDTTLVFFYHLNSEIPLDGNIFFRVEEPFEPAGKDHMVYILGGMLLGLGIIRVGFSKYYSDMVRIFTHTTFRQMSIRERLVQNWLASLLMNLFFCASAGLFLYQLAMHKNWLPPGGVWWQQLAFCVGFVAAIYLGKFITLKLSGWLFDLGDISDTYTFMVFHINKVIGVILLPATIALALGATNLQQVAEAASLMVLAFLFLYRYILAFPLLRQRVKVIPFHFFLYFCAFEIIPVLVIYKLMLLIIIG